MTVPFLTRKGVLSSMLMIVTDPMCGKVLGATTDLPFSFYRNYTARKFFCSSECKAKWEKEEKLYMEKHFRPKKKHFFTSNAPISFIFYELVGDSMFNSDDTPAPRLTDIDKNLRGI